MSSDLINLIPDAIQASLCLIDLKGDIVTVNKAWKDFADSNQLDHVNYCIGENYITVCEKSDSVSGQQTAQALKEILSGKRQFYSAEYDCHSPEEKRWFLILATPLFDTEIRGACLIHRNITDKKRAEQKLRKSRKKIRFLNNTIALNQERIKLSFEGSNDGIWDIDASTNSVFISPNYLKLLGYKPHEFGNTIEDLVRLAHPDDVNLIPKIIEDFKVSDKFDREFRMRAKSGEYKWVLGRAKVFVRDEKNTPVRIVGTFKDIHDRKAAEEELKSKTELQQKIFDNIPVMIVLIDSSGKINFVNREWERVIGWKSGVGENISELLTKIYPDPVYRAKVEQYIFNAENRWSEFLTTTEDGKTANTTWANIKLSDGSIIGIGEDLSEYKKKDAEIKRNQMYQDLILSLVPVILFSRSLTGNNIWVSDNIERITGYSKNLFEKDMEFWLKQFHPDDLASGLRTMNDPEGAHQYEHRWKCADGSYKWFLNYFVRTFKDGRPHEVHGAWFDITDRKQIELELNESREQLRQLTAHIEHIREDEKISIARDIHDDLGQSLTALKLMVMSLKNEAEDPDKLKHKIKLISKLLSRSIKSVGRIITQLRPEILDTLGLLAAIEWQAQELQESTGVIIKVSSLVENINFNSKGTIAIFRIFQETVTNALKHSQASFINIELYAENVSLIMKVTDNGVGLRRTKREGFGIIGVKERALMFGGNFEIISAPGSGTQAVLRIPLKNLI